MKYAYCYMTKLWIWWIFLDCLIAGYFVINHSLMHNDFAIALLTKHCIRNVNKITIFERLAIIERRSSLNLAWIWVNRCHRKNTIWLALIMRSHEISNYRQYLSIISTFLFLLLLLSLLYSFFRITNYLLFSFSSL